MNRKIRISGLLAAVLLSAAGCQDDFYVFEDSASERIAQGLAKCDQALLDGKTWVMEYFPSEEFEYGGWMYVLRFNEGHTVRAWFEGETFADDTYIETPYAVEHSTGPMLKFVNYNDYLHYFSFPGGNGGYQGYKGDYEFTFMDVSPDLITLRGVKTENYREDSFEHCYQSKLWTVSYTYQQQKTDSQGEPVFDDQSGEPVYEDVLVNDVLSFIAYPDGTMSLYEPYTFKGEVEGLADQTIQTFKWVKGAVSTADCFVCTDSLLEIRFEQ